MRIGSLIAKGASIFDALNRSASSPTITIDGSTTAGIFAPTAGQIAISVGAGVNAFELATDGKLTLTTGYDSLLPSAGVAGDEQAAITKKWAEDNFVIGQISSLNLGDLADVTFTGLANGDFLVRTAGVWANRDQAETQSDLALVPGTDVQAWDANLDQFAALSPATDNFIAGNSGGTSWELKTPATARTSLGLDAGGTGDIWVKRSGDSMDSAANITFSGGGEVLGLPSSPSGASAAASKAYVDSVSQGLIWLNPVYYVDLIDDSYGVNVTKDLQTPANDTSAQITTVEDSDMLIVGVGPSAQGLTWTAVGVTGNTTTTTGLISGDIVRWNSDAENGFVDPAWEKVQASNGGPNISTAIFFDEITVGLHQGAVRYGNGIVTDATKGGTFFGFENNIWELSIDDLDGSGPAIVITTTANGVTTDTADGVNATGFSFSTLQQGTVSLPEISQVTCNAASTLNSAGAADYFTMNSGGDVTLYHVWYNVSGGTNTDPAPGGSTGIQVDVDSADGPASVGSKTRSAIAASAGSDFLIDNDYDALWAIEESFGDKEVNTVTVETFANITENDYFFIYASVQAPSEIAKLVITDVAFANETDAVDVNTGFRITKLSDGDTVSIPERSLIEPNCARTLTQSGTGDYWTFSANATNYFVWYNFTDGSTVAPAPGGTAIQVDVTVNLCAGAVAQATAAAINSVASANVTATTTASFMDSTNVADGGLRFHVWFDKGTGVDPAPINSFEGIQVDISGATTQNDVAIAVRDAINGHRPMVGGSQVGQSVLWSATVSTTDVIITSTHPGRSTAAANGSGLSGGTWNYVRTTTGSYDGPANNSAFFVGNPDSFNFGNQYVYQDSSGEWSLFGGQQSLIPGTGLSQSGQFLNVNLGAGITELPADEVGVHLFSTSSGALILTTDGTTRDTSGSGGAPSSGSQVALKVNTTQFSQSTELTINGQGVTEAELSTSVAGGGLVGGNGTPLAVNPGQGVTLTGDLVEVDASATWFEFSGASPNGVLSIVASSITATELADDYVDVTGDTMTGDLTMGAGTQIFLAGDGTATDPGLSFVGDGDTGIFSVGGNQIGVSAGNTLVATFETNDLLMTVPVIHPLGGVGAPSVTFTGDTDTGMWSSGANTLDFATGAANRMSISATGLITTGGTGAAAYASLVTAASGTAIPNKQYVDDSVGAVSTTSIADSDGDTKVDVEEGADDDTVRMDTGDTPVGYGAVTDILLLNSGQLTVNMGTANSIGTVGAPISLTAGTGYTTGNGGNLSLFAGVAGATGTGGDVSINGGFAPGGTGGDVTISSGYSGSGTSGGGVFISNGGATSRLGAVISMPTNNNLVIQGSNGTGANNTGGIVAIYGGDGNGTGSGGLTRIHGGDGGASSGGGGMELYGGNGGATTGDGGTINIRGGAGNSATIGVGGYVNIYGGYSAADEPGGVQIVGGQSAGDAGGDVTILGGTGALNYSGGSVSISAASATGTGYGGNIVIDGGSASGSGSGGRVIIGAGSSATGTTGHISLRNGAPTSPAVELRFHQDSETTNYIGMKAGDTVTTSVTYTLPEAPAGDGYGLVSTTGGVMSWVDISASLDNTKITDGGAGTAETYIDTDEATDQITSQVGATANHAEYEPLRAGISGAVSLTGAEALGVNNGGNLQFNAGGGLGGGNGGNVTINAGPGRSGGSGGNISLTAGSDNGQTGTGGNILLYGGYGDVASGNALLATKNSSGNSGSITIRTGNAGTGGTAGNITLQGYGTDTDAADIILDAGNTTGTANGGEIHLYAGDATGSGTGGPVKIKAGDSGSGPVGHIELSTSDPALPVSVRFPEASSQGTDWISLRAPTSITTTREWVLPQNAPVDGYVLKTDGSGNTAWESLATLSSTGLSFGDLSDIIDTVPYTDDVVSVLVGDGSNKETQQLVGGTNLTQVVNNPGNTVTLNVDDAFISNNGGDTFGDSVSGSWVVASGSNITIASGADLIITDDPVSSTDAVNKAYVDSISAGLDPKESVTVATAVGEDLTGGSWGGTYNVSGGPTGTGSFTTVNLTVAIDGTTNANTLGARVLVKNQTDARQNGIYEVTVTGVSGTLIRAPDQDGSPSSEVSAGNFTFVETGTQANSGWVTTGSGILTLNTDNINWTQFSGAGSFTAGIGISQSGNTIDLDLNDLVTATIVSADVLGFHDADGTASSSGSQTRKTSVANFISDLNILTGGASPNFLAQDGVRYDTGTDAFELDINGLLSATIVGADELVFDDGASGNHAKTTVTNFLNDLDIVNVGTFVSPGFIKRTADDTYVSTHSFAPSTTNDELGIAVGNGDGSAGAVTTIGLDIVGLTALGAAPASNDSIAIYDLSGTVNRKVTVSNLALAVSSASTIGGLSDVNADSTTDAAGNVLVADGTDSYDTRKIQHIQPVTSQTSIIVNHNIGQKFVIVQCYNSSDVSVLPNSVTLTDANNCTVTFSPAFTGNIVVMGIPGVV